MPTVPEWLPGEPKRTRASFFGVRLALRALLIALIATLTLPLWPLYGLGVLIWGVPPNVPRGAQLARYLRLVARVQPPPPGLPPLSRLWLLLSVLRKVAVTPFWGLAWHLDEALYGRALAQRPLVAPLFEISAARSGSTQLARYLEEDPQLATPSLLQFMFPYLWLWKLVPRTLGRVITPDRVRAKLDELFPPEFLERHEGDPFRTDTFDGALYVAHLNHLAPFLGPEVLVEDFGFGQCAPHNRALWGRIFPDLVEGIGRKTLLLQDPAGTGRRFFLKGHFLAGADALAERFPDARFLTVIREPAPRLKSCLNFLRANPVDPSFGPVPWAWLAEALPRTEAAYCEREQAWFTAPEGPIRHVVRFQDFVRDLDGSLRGVYRTCLDQPAPPRVHAHPERARSGYLLNRDLAGLGIDEDALNTRLAAYRAWCAGA